MTFARIVLWGIALLLLVLGGVGFVAPETVMGMTGIEAPNAVARSEARLIFGMLHLLLGGFFASSALGLSRTPTDSALLLAAVLFGGMGVARIVVILIDGSGSAFHPQGVGVDFVIAALALWARRGIREAG